MPVQPATVDSNYLTLLDSVDAVIYVADMKTYEILYLNKKARDTSNGRVGSICWKTLQANQNGPCPFCTNNCLLDKLGKPTAPYVWEVQNTINSEWWECRDQAIKWSDGRLVRLEIATNITQRKQAQKIGEKAQKLFKELFENMSSGVAIYEAIDNGKNFVFKQFNRAAEKIENIAREKVIGFKVTDKFPGVEEFGLLSVFQRVWETAVPEYFPVSTYQDKRIKGWRDNYVFKLATGEIVAIYDDVTAQKQGEQELLEKKERLSFALHGANSGMWDWNLKTAEVTFDENYYKMAGYEPFEFPQSFEEWEKRVHPDDLKRVKDTIQSTLTHHPEQFTAEFRFKTKSATWMWILAQGKVIQWDINGEPVRFIGLHTGTDKIKEAELALRESANRLKLTLESAELGSWDWNPMSGAVVFNDRWATMLGYRREELKPHVETWYNLLHPDDVAETMEHINAHLNGHTPIYQTEFRMRTKSGQWKWILDTGKVTQHNDQGQPIRMTGIHQDITERKQIEQALSQSEQQYRTIFENSIVGLSRSTPEGRYLIANQAFARILGYDSAEKLLRETTDITTQRYIDAHDRDNLKQLLNEHETVENFEYRVRCKDGTERWISSSVRLVRDDNGKIAYYEGVSIDINDRKLMENALRTSEENLRITLNSIGDAVIACDIDHKVIRMNPVAEKLTGWTETQAKGQPLGQVFHIINVKTGQLAESPVEKVLKTENIVALANHTVLIARDGRESQIADSAAPIRDKSNNITGVVLVFRDVTEEYRIREELHKMQQLESIGTLAGGIAHDFNNILAGIFGNIALAKQRAEANHPSLKYLEQAEISANRAKNLTGQLLTFAKGGEPIKDHVSVEELIKEVANFDLSGSKVKLLYDYPDDLWPAEVDKAQMQQVISNLVINAIQAMPDGGHLHIQLKNSEISAHAVTELKAGKYVQVTVRDEGAGIAEKYLSRIFDPYFSTKQTGRGLGLATVYSIINRHDGHIKVTSQTGVGTTFTLYLPAAQESQKVSTEELTNETIGERKALKVLLMDDEDIIRTLTTEMLIRLGGTTDTATNGEETLMLYRQALQGGTPYDLVIMDLTIPGGMGGKQAIKSLLEIDPEARAIVSSGYADDPVMALYHNYGFKGVVAKPYTLNELKFAIEKAMTD